MNLKDGVRWLWWNLLLVKSLIKRYIFYKCSTLLVL
jgi:hypothetical protein